MSTVVKEREITIRQEVPDMKDTLFGDIAPTGEELKQQGGESAVAHTPEEYITRFEREAHRMLAASKEITADDVFNVVGEPPNHRNAVGGLFQSFARKKFILPAGFRASTRADRRGGVNRVWKQGEEFANWVIEEDDES